MPLDKDFVRPHPRRLSGGYEGRLVQLQGPLLPHSGDRLREYPIMDTMVATMVLADKEITGKNPCLASGPPKVLDDDLRATYSSLFLGRLTNVAMLLQEYLQKLLPQRGGQDVLQ
ncbi:hypothetical protein AAFF_G00235440 [Aldrovandia affinis]|uniref:Uncharacterized protein n=1 Tax=Aldrovandia affinis TaxID=143900 RepID=A0AAD7WTX5_9TELE|nr:hypothetical protein AAFF_G00235440 [Aldrovandia affinis]